MAYRYGMPDVNVAWSELKAVGKQTSTLPLSLYSVSKQDEPILTCSISAISSPRVKFALKLNPKTSAKDKAV
jgi:hypothetical protein